ncbi:hypothetical protein [uncultured Methanobrevibacter sp.]|jgi:hypothetical protein|uniref:hypothetical protein n=1 Tax=uncultured Methanobrevibacter sp. TaxID=253161 RepID=UPI0025CEBAD9|nr:hypothetical protein [uncultured Methanobrevibacter sp.]
MTKKIIIFLFALIVLINAANAIDSSNWTTANVGYENFKIPPQYANPYKSDFNMYEADEDIDVFTIRYVNPNIMSLYGYYLEKYPEKKVSVSGHDAVHFTYYDRHDGTNNSILWFSSGEEFYYITWIGHNISKEVKEIVKSSSPSKYSHDEFYDILDDEFKNYKIVNAIESQRYDSPSNDNRHHSFFSVGTNGVSVGVIS